MTKIAFFGTKPYDSKSFNEINSNYWLEITYFEEHTSKENIKKLKWYDVICLFVNDNLDADMIQVASEVGIKMIALRCAGFNNVDIEACKNHNITVARVPAYSPFAVAEFAMWLLLSLVRKIHITNKRTSNNNFSINWLLWFDLNEKTIWIIGTGKIWQIMMKICQWFGMKILAFDTYPNPNLKNEINFEYVSLDELYSKSDIISLHCPLFPETQYMINKDSISKMKKWVFIINTSRWWLINTQDLIDWLKTAHIGSAGLDVYEWESEYFFNDTEHKPILDDKLARLLNFRNVIVSSHQAFFTKEAMDNIAKTTLENIKNFFENKDLWATLVN